jgi:hypothetical protein
VTAFSTGKLREALISKMGFEQSQTDHEIFELVLDGLVVATTKMSHKNPGRDVGDVLLGKMAKQCRVSAPNFKRTVSCQISGQDYQTLVREALSGH